MKRRAFFTAAFGAIGALFARKAVPATKYDLSRIRGEPLVLGFSGFSDPEKRYCRTETVIGYTHEADAKRLLCVRLQAEYLGNKPQDCILNEAAGRCVR